MYSYFYIHTLYDACFRDHVQCAVCFWSVVFLPLAIFIISIFVLIYFEMLQFTYTYTITVIQHYISLQNLQKTQKKPYNTTYVQANCIVISELAAFGAVHPHRIH